MHEHPGMHRGCCAASDWVRQRTAASFRAWQDYYQQLVVQVGHRGGRVLRMVRLPLLLRSWLPACAVVLPSPNMSRPAPTEGNGGARCS